MMHVDPRVSCWVMIDYGVVMLVLTVSMLMANWGSSSSSSDTSSMAAAELLAVIYCPPDTCTETVLVN
jgi:hypothetical protein